MITADDLFMQNACQYYATARFAMHARCAPVCGNLFHHAVEMFLKVGLAQRRELSDLERMRHKLKEKLWPAFQGGLSQSPPDTARQNNCMCR